MFQDKSLIQVFVSQRIFFEIQLNICCAFKTKHLALILRYLYVKEIHVFSHLGRKKVHFGFDPKSTEVSSAYFAIFSIDKEGFSAFWIVFLSLKIVFTPRCLLSTNQKAPFTLRNWDNTERKNKYIYFFICACLVIFFDFLQSDWLQERAFLNATRTRSSCGKSKGQRSAESRGFSPGTPVSSHRES